MSYPSLEQYNEALQHPQSALLDPELKRGVVATTGLGLPLALCGGFALTYTVSVGGKKYAVRCFHKQSKALEQRYAAITRQLLALRSGYFVDFEFQPQGARVAGGLYPVVKMAWASGTTLGEFLESAHGRPAELLQLVESLKSLAAFLEQAAIAHGDLQPDNVMVALGGKQLHLIDYDGMYVKELDAVGAAELGQRNFQHPGRTSSYWNAKLDRFSLILLTLALRALAEKPGLWAETHSEGAAVLLRANDFASPAQSTVLRELTALPGVGRDAKNFAAICASPIDVVPTLEDFLAGRNIPAALVSWAPMPAAPRPQYVGAYPVLDAANYDLCLGFVGDRVELVGMVVEVRESRTKSGKPYVFVNFGNWRGKMVKVSYWSDGLALTDVRPSRAWVGRWVAAVGLLDPPYRNASIGYTHLSITISQRGQLHLLSEEEAALRLASVRGVETATRVLVTNRKVIDQMKGRSGGTPQAPAAVGAPASPNQAVLRKMAGSTPTPPPMARPPHQAPSGGTEQNWSWLWWLIGILGLFALLGG